MKRAYDLMCALSYWKRQMNDFIEVETVEGWFWLDHFAG